MQRPKSVLLMLVVLLSLLLLISSIGIQGQDAKVLVIGHSEVTESYDLAYAFNPTSGMVHQVTYDTLVTFPESDTSAILPNLAESWTISEDGTLYTFSLRSDVTFANGDLLTAADVAFSIQRLKNIQSNPSFLADAITGVEAVDDLTVAITIDAPRPSFLVELTNSSFSVSNDDQVREAGGTDAADAMETDTAVEFLDQNSVGTGPYILQSWSPQEETVLVRNENYWGEAPYFDEIIIVNIPEASTQKVALESGDIDIATDLSSDQIAELADNPDIGIFQGIDQWTHFLLMNRDPEIGGPVSDPTVGLAIRYALDYAGFRELWPGSVTPGSNMWIGIQGAYGQDKAFERDLDKARELLAEAGYADGFEIELGYPDLTFSGINLSTNAQKVQADLAEIGITVNLRPKELQIALEDYRNGNESLAYWFWGPDIMDPVDFLSFMPGGKVAGERTNWFEGPPEIMELIAQAQVESDSMVRTEIFNQLQDFAQQSGAYAPFMVPTIQVAHRADVQNVIWHPDWVLDVSIMSRAE